MRILLLFAALSLVVAGSALAVTQGKVLFSDTFSKASKEWKLGKTEYATSSLHAGKLRMATKPGMGAWLAPLHVFSPTVRDIDVQVSARLVSGNHHNNMGVVCLTGNYARYNVLIGSNGVYGLARVNAQDSATLLKKGYDKTAIRATGVNAIRAHCTSAGTVELFVNGKKLFTVVDKAPLGRFERGGVFASANDKTSGATIDFDNLKVVQN
jgi:hypothetical protein